MLEFAQKYGIEVLADALHMLEIYVPADVEELITRTKGELNNVQKKIPENGTVST